MKDFLKKAKELLPSLGAFCGLILAGALGFEAESILDYCVAANLLLLATIYPSLFWFLEKKIK